MKERNNEIHFSCLHFVNRNNIERFSMVTQKKPTSNNVICLCVAADHYFSIGHILTPNYVIINYRL